MTPLSGKWDAHTHCTDPDHPMTATATYWQQQKLDGLIFGGIDPSDWDNQSRIKDACPITVLTSYGLHPWFIQQNPEPVCESAFGLLQQRISEADALGECGLDYFVAKTPEERQRQDRWCERHLDFAKQCHKPLILHVVRAHEPMLRQLQKTSGFRGLVHAFTADVTTAQAYLSLGFKISLDRRINPEKLATLLRGLPADAWVIESDAHGPDALGQMAERCATALGQSAEAILAAQGAKLGQIFTGA